MPIRLIACILLLIVLLGAVVFAPSLGQSIWMNELHNSAHGPIFGCVALLVLVGLRHLHGFSSQTRIHQYLVAFGSAVVLGALVELAQVPTGRDASWTDLVNDTFGALGFLLVYAAFEKSAGKGRHGLRASLLLCGLVAIAIMFAPLATTGVAYARRSSAFPTLLDSSSGIGKRFIGSRFAELSKAELPEHLQQSPNEQALLIRFQAGSWPGVQIREPMPDWRGYRTLLLDVTNPCDTEIAFMVRIDDRSHNQRYEDRYNRKFHIAPGKRALLRIPLSDIASAPRDRSFDLANVAAILVFRAGESNTEAMYLSRVWLE